MFHSFIHSILAPGQSFKGKKERSFVSICTNKFTLNVKLLHSLLICSFSFLSASTRTETSKCDRPTESLSVPQWQKGLAALWLCGTWSLGQSQNYCRYQWLVRMHWNLKFLAEIHTSRVNTLLKAATPLFTKLLRLGLFVHTSLKSRCYNWVT